MHRLPVVLVAVRPFEARLALQPRTGFLAVRADLEVDVALDFVLAFARGFGRGWSGAHPCIVKPVRLSRER